MYNYFNLAIYVAGARWWLFCLGWMQYPEYEPGLSARNSRMIVDIAFLPSFLSGG
jgi:hypothetical protein